MVGDSAFLIPNYKLSLSYPAPSLSKEIESPRVRNSASFQHSNPPASKIDISRISFKGSSYNKEQGVYLAIMSLDGEEIISKEGDLIDKAKIVKIMNDSVALLITKKIVWLKRDNVIK